MLNNSEEVKVMVKPGKINLTNILVAAFGVFFTATGAVFNQCAGLGNDCIGIVYDGMRSFLNLNPEQLGMASNVVNISLVVLLLFIGRRYISVGTLVYFLPYGFYADIARALYSVLAFSDGMANNILFSVIGCLSLYFGVATYITVEIGVDPFTGLVLWLTEKLKKEYRYVKIVFDLVMIALGWALGGKLGVVTIITAFTAGPCIQFFNQKIRKILVRE